MPIALTLFTVGHSSRTLDELIDLLQHRGVEMLVDIRSNPVSERHQQFGQNNLRAACEQSGIEYYWSGRQLGGRRHANAESRHGGLIDEGLRAFADYMDTTEFNKALQQLVGLANKGVTAVLCAEKLPERCHRSLLADAMTLQGATVIHLIDDVEARVHQLNECLRRDSTEPVYDRNQQGKLLH